MAEHPNVALVRRAMQAMNEMDMSRADQEMAIVEAFMADDIVWHEIGRDEPRRGKDELRATMSTMSDVTIKYELHDVVANDDHAIALGTATATRNGKTLIYRTAEIFHIRDGKATERWAFSDDTSAIVAFFAAEPSVDHHQRRDPGQRAVRAGLRELRLRAPRSSSGSRGAPRAGPAGSGRRTRAPHRTPGRCASSAPSRAWSSARRTACGWWCPS